MAEECCSIDEQLCFTSLSHTWKHRNSFRGNLLGLGDEQRVREEEEVSLLDLKAGLELRLGVTQEQAAGTLGQEGLDEGTRLRAHWRQAAFPEGQKPRQAQNEILCRSPKEKFVVWILWRPAPKQQVPNPAVACGQEIAQIPFNPLNYSNMAIE